ncbi:MAG: GMC family oxidoreductase [Rhodothalassiaceae bacterium]
MPEERFDYIICGAGSAGCALAGRLAEAGSTVLLLEAGPKDRNPFIHIPVGYGVTLQSTGVNWQFETEPDAGTNNRVHLWPRGKTLGGSSAINAMLYIRGHPSDYDGWAQQGLHGWDWESVLPYFMRAQDQARGALPGHGVGGPLHVSDPSFDHPVSDALVEAAQQYGLPLCKDFNTGDPEGVGFYQLTIKNGRRVSAATAYLASAPQDRLSVRCGALAHHIVFDQGRAAAVRYSQGGRIRQARAQREVIVSGGAINTPQLLELSGIGDGERLRDLGIETIAHRPGVGENLQDHFNVAISYRLKKGTPSVNAMGRGFGMAREFVRYLSTRKGFFAISAAHVGLFVKSRPDLACPDLQYHALAGSLDPGKYLQNKLQFEKEPGMTIGHCVLRPQSLGSVHARSADPADRPAIRPNYLTAREDAQALLAGYHITRAITAQPALAPFIDHETQPGPEVVEEDALLAHARDKGGTIYHPVGTARMGRSDDLHAVVDDHLRVIGVEGLRVVDASVMPKLVSGNTNAPAIMIGEKAADMILGRTPPPPVTLKGAQAA